MRSTRQQYHTQIVHVLEKQFPETVETQPELLAHHASEAGLSEQAVHYWHQAGEKAREQVAHTEAISYLTKGVALLRTLPATPARAQHELTLCFALGTSLMTVKGLAASRATQGQTEEGLPLIAQGIVAIRTAGLRYDMIHYLAMLAEVYGTVGQIEEGCATLAEVLDLVDQTGARQYESELHRLKGQLLLQQSSENQTEAENCFHQALDIARQQQAKSWELRAATSLAKLWQRQNKRKDAYELLAPVYGWFTEGFDTADLIEAKALLDALA